MAIGRTSVRAGGTGGELTVNAPVGVKVIATNSETGRTYTRTANADGVAVFKGLPEGMYNVTITDGERTSDPVPAKVVYKSETTVAFFQATIEITYPEGSTCTVSDGETTFAAPDTTGTWTLTITDESQTNSRDIAVDTHGQSVSVRLNYRVYLYNRGDMCSSVSGGWSSSNYKQASGSPSGGSGQDNDHLYCIGSYGTYEGCNGMQAKVDLADYSILGYVGWSDNQTNNYVWVVTTRSLFGGNYVARGDLPLTKTTVDATTIDITSLTGSYYICFTSHHNSGASEIYEMYIE